MKTPLRDWLGHGTISRAIIHCVQHCGCEPSFVAQGVGCFKDSWKDQLDERSLHFLVFLKTRQGTL